MPSPFTRLRYFSAVVFEGSKTYRFSSPDVKLFSPAGIFFVCQNPLALVPASVVPEGSQTYRFGFPQVKFCLSLECIAVSTRGLHDNGRYARRVAI
jgi:hypothetical protein